MKEYLYGVFKPLLAILVTFGYLCYKLVFAPLVIFVVLTGVLVFRLVVEYFPLVVIIAILIYGGLL